MHQLLCIMKNNVKKRNNVLLHLNSHESVLQVFPNVRIPLLRRSCVPLIDCPPLLLTMLSQTHTPYSSSKWVFQIHYNQLPVKSMLKLFKNATKESDAKIDLRLRALADLAEDQGSVSLTHIAVHIPLNTCSKASDVFSDFNGHHARTQYTYIHKTQHSYP